MLLNFYFRNLHKASLNMKEFISKVLSHSNKFHQDSLTYKDRKKVEECVLESWDVDNMIALRDKYEGDAFFEKFLQKIISIIILENLLKKELINWNTIDPKNYKPTLNIKGMTIDVITSNFGEFPIINIENKNPAIIAIKKDDKNVWICGFADKKTLNCRQDESLLKSGATKGFNNKTAFIGFDELKLFKSIGDLEQILNL